MNIPEAQIVLKKKVGKSNGNDVTHIKTVGGLHLVVNHKGIVLGSGPHRSVARHLAQKFDPNINWVELSKAEHVPEEHFEHLLPEYMELTKTLRSAQGIKD